MLGERCNVSDKKSQLSQTKKKWTNFVTTSIIKIIIIYILLLLYINRLSGFLWKTQDRGNRKTTPPEDRGNWTSL